jgi:hypothetical protein
MEALQAAGTTVASAAARSAGRLAAPALAGTAGAAATAAVAASAVAAEGGVVAVGAAVEATADPVVYGACDRPGGKARRGDSGGNAMWAWTLARTVGLGLAGAALVLGCSMQGDDGSGSSGGFAGGGSSSGGGAGTGPSPKPMLVVVDPNQTMNATPGEGVGVFVQYTTGGHWNIWWTCDTNKTGEQCAFDNTVTVSTGTIDNLAGQQLEKGDTATQASAQSVEAQTTTTTNVDGITFDTPTSSGQIPVITLDAKLNGIESDGFIFFVEDREINGGYQGMLTDPLLLEPLTL